MCGILKQNLILLGFIQSVQKVWKLLLSLLPNWSTHLIGIITNV